MNYYTNNIRHVKGDTFSCAMEIDELGQDLESVYFTCRDSLNDDSELLFEVSLGNGITLVEHDQENDIRKYAIRIPPSATKDLQSGTYYYDLQIGVNSDIFTVMRGEFILEQEATQDTAPAPDPEAYIKVILDQINGEVIGTTVVNKTDYLAETKSLIRTNINNFGGNIGTSDTFRSYAGAISTIRSQFNNLFDKNNANVVKLNTSTTTVGNTGTYATASMQTHVYIECEPNTVYAIIKDTTINTVLGAFESEEAPAIGVDYTVLYYSGANTQGTTMVRTSNNAHYLDIRIINTTTSDEDKQTIIDSIQIYDMTPIINLNT